MKAMIGQLASMSDTELSLEFYVLLYEDDGTLVKRCSINVPYTASTNQNQLLPLAKQETITAAAQIGRTIGVNDIKSAVLQ